MLLFLPFLALAEVVVPIDSVENHVNIRMSADSDSEIVGRLNQGEYLNLVASSDGWHEVEIAGGATGFISADWSVVLAEPPVPASDEDSGDSASVGEASLAEDGESALTSAEAPASEEAALKELDSALPGGDIAGAEDVPSEAGPGDASMPPAAGDETVSATENEPDEAVSIDVVVGPQSGGMALEDGEAPAAIEDEESDVTEEIVIDEHASIAAAGSDVAIVDAEAIGDGADGTGLTTGVAEPGPQGPPGPPGPQGPAGAASIEGSVGFLAKFTAPTIGASSQVYDDGNNVGIGTTEPKQRLEVNGNIQIHERNSSVAGLMITQSDGDTGYIMHNRASTLTIGAGSVDRITIDRNGNVGFGVSRPANPIEMASGAHVTAGGVWTNSSSRARKENIAELSLEDALSTLTQLEPVQFNYKNDRSEQYLGFIAEDVPDLVATSDRDGLSSMDIVAVLTRVVQEQQKKIEQLEARLDRK